MAYSTRLLTIVRPFGVHLSKIYFFTGLMRLLRPVLGSTFCPPGLVCRTGF